MIALKDFFNVIYFIKMFDHCNMTRVKVVRLGIINSAKVLEHAKSKKILSYLFHTNIIGNISIFTERSFEKV